MKNKVFIFLLLILAFGCANNDFSNTNSYFETDKETYHINDSFKLTLFVSPIEGEKTIRFFKNFSNINVSFISVENQYGFHQELKKRFIEFPIETNDESENVDEYFISKTKPFKKTFIGTISEFNGNVIIQIPELKTSDTIDLIKHPYIGVKGSLKTVNGIIEESINLSIFKIIE